MAQNLCRLLNIIGAVSVLAAVFVNPSFGSGVQIIDAPAGQQVDVYTEYNVSGKLWLKIASQTGEPCANFWWIKWPFGVVQHVGRHCGAFTLEIPSLFSATVGSRLRAGGYTDNLKIALSANESVAHSVTIQFP